MRRTGFVLLLLLLAAAAAVQGARLPGGTPLPRIQCSGILALHHAETHAAGLISPDGLAFAPDGALYVVEETAGRVSLVAADGATSTLLSGLNSPEGIAAAPDGTFWVVEDVADGRLLQRTPDGSVSTLATNRNAPEGVARSADGTLYLSESTVQLSGNPFTWVSHLTRVTPAGQVTRILTTTLTISFSDLAIGGDGLLYAGNELAGSGPISLSVVVVDPAAPSPDPYAVDLVAVEGLAFDPLFPWLYVVEEDAGSGGLLTAVDSSGAIVGRCSGFFSIEDVAAAADGTLYVTEDGSGLLIRLAPPLRASSYLPSVARR